MRGSPLHVRGTRRADEEKRTQISKWQVAGGLVKQYPYVNIGSQTTGAKTATSTSTVLAKMLAGNLFLRIGGFEVFHLPKNFAV